MARISIEDISAKNENIKGKMPAGLMGFHNDPVSNNDVFLYDNTTDLSQDADSDGIKYLFNTIRG